tara:strand:+ start:685 stop:1329 length:645 start_codon:yes stop_codon:yes gene_type:complete
MNNMNSWRKRADGRPDFTEGSPEWAFNKDTVDQLTTIMRQLEKHDYIVQTRILWNPDDKDVDKESLTLEEYQDCINGLSVLAHKRGTDKDGNYYKVIVETDAGDDSINVLAGFGSEKRPMDDLWNQGLIYHKKYDMSELGKFSALWEKINRNLLTIKDVVPIFAPKRPHPQHRDYPTDLSSNIEERFNKFIDAALDGGVVKRIRKQKKSEPESD